MCFSGTLLVSRTVVSTPPLTDCSLSGSVPPSVQSPVSAPFRRRRIVSPGSGYPTLDSLEAERRAWRAARFSAVTAGRVKRTVTRSTYNSKTDTFCKWCYDRHPNFARVPVPEVLELFSPCLPLLRYLQSWAT